MHTYIYIYIEFFVYIENSYTYRAIHHIYKCRNKYVICNMICYDVICCDMKCCDLTCCDMIFGDMICGTMI